MISWPFCVNICPTASVSNSCEPRLCWARISPIRFWKFRNSSKTRLERNEDRPKWLFKIVKRAIVWNWWFQNMINYIIIRIHVIYFNLLLIEFFEKALGYKSKVPWLMEKDPEAQWQLQNVHIMFIVFHLLMAAILYESIGSLSHGVRGYILGDAGFLPPIANRYQ